MTLRNLSAFICIALVSCAANPVPSAHKHYNEYTVQICMPDVGSIGGDAAQKRIIATLFILPVGSTVDDYRVYQTNVLDSQPDPLHWIVIEVRNKDQKRYFSYSFSHPSPRQVEWSSWRPADFWTYGSPSMSYVYGGTAFRPSAPSSDSPVLRYRLLKSHEPNWWTRYARHLTQALGT
jgi:hypothetical protein